jgi:Rrf2 family protein
MLKLSKKVDYALILLGRLQSAGAGSGVAGLQAASAREMAERYRLPQPMVANILKSLTGAGILTSTRGVLGGYALARDAGSISLADLVEALDGPIGLMDCTSAQTTCEHQSGCPMHSPIQRVHARFRAFMASYTLADIFTGTEPGRPLAWTFRRAAVAPLRTVPGESSDAGSSHEAAYLPR